MKKNIKVLIVTTVLCLSLLGFATAESRIVDGMDFSDNGINLTLEEAIDVMLKDSPTVKQAYFDKEVAEVDYERNRRAIKKLKKLYKDKKEDSIDYIKGVKLFELKNNYGKENAERNYEATIEKLKAEVEESYFGLLQAQELEEINKTNLEIAKDLHDKTNKKYELGLIAEQEVFNSELNLIEAENDFKSAVNNLKLAKMMLNQNLGYDVMTEIVLEDKLEYKEFELESIADAISKAFINRNEIKAVEFGYEIEKINMDVIIKQYPEITFFYREQKIKTEKSEKSLTDTKKSIEVEVRNNYLVLLQKQEEIKAGQKSVELAKEALRLSQLSYDMGRSVLIDVQKAQTTLLQAELGLSKAVLDYNLAVIMFEDSIGVGRTSISFSG